MPKLIKDLDELNLRELFETQHEWTSDVIECAIRLATPCKVNVYTAIYKDNASIAGKPIAYDRQTLVSFHIPGTLEEFIKYRDDRIV